MSNEPSKRFGTFFSCLNCEGGPCFDTTEEFKKHLKEAHQITDMKGTKTLTCHMDGSDWYSSDYEIVLSGVKFGMHCCSKRKKSERFY